MLSIIFRTCLRECHHRNRVAFYSTMEFMSDYDPPTWAFPLKNVPNKKMKLAMTPTPIHSWNLPGVPQDFNVSIKRDDMTGSTLSGNKIRKLEFLLADALMRKCSHVITCGSLQSNHCRAVAAASRQLGLQTHLVLRSPIQDVDGIDCSGNLLLDRLCGSRIYLAPLKCTYEEGLLPRMEKLAQKIKSSTGEESYVMPVGGSNSIGLFGYIQMFNELLGQGAADGFDDIVFTCGSGGTAAGLAIANFLTGSKMRIHGISVCDDAAYFHGHVNEMIQEAGLKCRSEDILDMIDGHKGRGYGLSTQEELDFVLSVASTTGIMLDPVYTGKGAKGLVHELNSNPDMFKGKRILFIHTGGVFGLYDGKMSETLKQSGSVSNQVYSWHELEKVPV